MVVYSKIVRTGGRGPRGGERPHNFGRYLNPILIGGAGIAHHITTPPGFYEFPTALHLEEKKSVSILVPRKKGSCFCRLHALHST